MAKKPERKIDCVAVRSTERLAALREAFKEAIAAVNELEGMVLNSSDKHKQHVLNGGERIDSTIVGYNVGRLFASFKDILRILELKLEIEEK